MSKPELTLFVVAMFAGLIFGVLISMILLSILN